MDNSQIATLFKAYDVRGLVPEELSIDLAYRIGRALVEYLDIDVVCVGRDMRISGAALAGSLIDGITDQGADVVDIGLISTDGLYFSVGKYGFPAGVMITASHNPGKYNGFKFCRSEARPLSMDEGIGEIRDLVLAGQFDNPSRPGDVSQMDVTAEFIEHAFSMVDVARIKPMKIVADAGNGMAGKILPAVFEQLPGELVPLYFELDGTFPNHDANPLEPENIVDLQRTVLEQGADLGVAFDGDADRMFIIDEHGHFVGGDMITALVSKLLLHKHPGSAIVYNLICSRTVEEVILESGGVPIRSRVGHSFIKALMREHDAIFGGEHSGHFYFRDNWYADSGLIAFLTVLELLSAADMRIGEYLRPIDNRVRSGEINFTVNDPDTSFQIVHDRFSDADIDHLDGLTVSYPDWWFNLRASNTQPLVRLNVEADTRAMLDRRVAELTFLLNS